MITIASRHSCRIQAFGTVQGVGFRYGTLFLAKKLDITGTVENLPDESVLILAQGSEDALLTFIARLEKGPTRAANVTHLVINWENGSVSTTDFTII